MGGTLPNALAEVAMCRGAAHVHPGAEHLLAELLHDIAVALDPAHSEAVVIGPVDFGGDEPARSVPVGPLWKVDP